MLCSKTVTGLQPTTTTPSPARLSGGAQKTTSTTCPERSPTPHYLLIITHPSICSQQSPTPHHHLHLNKSKRITNSSPSQTITSYFRYPPSYTTCTNHHTQPPTHVLTQLVDDDWMVETDAEFLSGGGRGERPVRPKGRRCKLKSL